MYELIQLSEHDYYIESPTKIGIVKISDDDVVLIDSGNDKDAGKKVLRVLEAQGWHLAAIFNTHSHADHTGGNRFLQDRTGCKIYAAPLECDYVNHPIFEPVSLYGGFPFADLRHKFLMAQESKAEPLTAEVLPEGMEILPLPGHSFEMVGFRTADGNVFIADSLSSVETIEKYSIGFLWDVESYLATLEKVKTLEAVNYIPAHAAVTESIVPLAQYNIDAVQRIVDKIAEVCAEPVIFDALMQNVFDAFGMTLNISQFVLIGSTLRSYLAYLLKLGKVRYFFENNMMYWERV